MLTEFTQLLLLIHTEVITGVFFSVKTLHLSRFKLQTLWQVHILWLYFKAALISIFKFTTDQMTLSVVKNPQTIITKLCSTGHFSFFSADYFVFLRLITLLFSFIRPLLLITRFQPRHTSLKASIKPAVHYLPHYQIEDRHSKRLAGKHG